MSIKTLANKATSKVGRQILITQKHSPVLLLGIGVTGVITTIVLACQATLKVSEILDEAETNTKTIEDAEENRDDYTEEDAKKDSVLNKVQTAGKIAKLYAPAFIVGVISIGALTSSHVILTRRNVGLTAAYAAIDKGFREYRERVVGELGEGKDREFRYGVVEREIAVETDDGIAVKTIREVDRTKGPSIYAKFFDESNPNWERTSSAHNQTFVSVQRQYANDLLDARGHVLLNDVYEMLGFPRTSEGAVVGWLRNNHAGDNYISFGVFDHDIYMGQQFANGNERSVLLDFNVDGVIYDKIGEEA